MWLSAETPGLIREMAPQTERRAKAVVVCMPAMLQAGWAPQERVAESEQASGAVGLDRSPGRT